jgi:hypothetical protein
MFAAPASKTTSIERRHPRCAGASLAEYVFALALVGLFAVVIVTLSVNTGRSFAELTNYVDLDNYNRVALDYLTREIRQVTHVSAFATNSIAFVDKDGQPLTYTYSPAERALKRTKNGATTTVLRDCDALEFGVFQRTPMTNSFDLYPTAQVTNAKVVTVRWNCARHLLGVRANTEHAQLARIVIRNKQEQ